MNARLLSRIAPGRLLLLALVAGCGEPTLTPDAAQLLRAGENAGEWLLPNKSYEGNRYSRLAQINADNVGTLGLVWQTAVGDDGEQEAAPIVTGGTMYVSTPHDNVLALDARTGKLKWHFPYNPSAVLLYAVSRGVGVANGRVFVATQDCHVIALDAATGKPVWNVVGCRDTTNSWYSMASYVYKDAVIVGTAGGDTGNRGLVSAFSTADGKRLWDWETIDRTTWPDSSWVHGGAAVWSGLAINPRTSTLFVAPGNPGPDMVLDGRKGQDLYSNSLVALDMSHGAPTVKWHQQLVQDDTHDSDPAMIPVAFTGTVGGRARELVAIGDKAGNFLILDQATGAVVHRLAVSDQTGIFTTVPTLTGTTACPNHGGGIEWNPGAYDPASNLFVVASTQECGFWKLQTEHPIYVPGQPYTGGPLPARRAGTGLLTAVDVATGKVRWRAPLTYSAQGGALITWTGLVFTSDVGGTLYAFDVTTGNQLWTTRTGASIVAPITAYAVDGNERLAVMVGPAGNQQTPNVPRVQGSRVLVYGLGATTPIVNGLQGQIVQRSPSGAGESAPAVMSATDSLPYTPAQVASGAAVYASSCASCHGAQLQGVAGPALTGTAIARAHPSVSQLRTTVTTLMPLTAPGSLTPAQYAAVMAYIVAYDCIRPSGGGKIPFPMTDAPALAMVAIGPATCPQR